ncbi:MAG: class E sortase [Acidimicrobiales bacterium]
MACSAEASDPAGLQRHGAALSPRDEVGTTSPTTSTSVVGPDLSAAATEAEEAGAVAAPEAAPSVAVQDPIPTGARAASRPARSSSRRGPEPTGHIEIPSIRLAHDTYEGIDLPTIDHGPSHWPGTALPGNRGNTVFPGHRTTHSRPFWDIDRIRVGDEVIFSNASGRYTYRATKTFVVDDEDTYIVNQTENATFTIFACHPKGSARQRYVVQGELVASEGTPPPPSSTTTTTTTTAPPGPIDGLFD